MRVCLLFVFTCVLGVSLFAQDSAALLKKRMEEYMLLSKQANFERVMDYMHPSLFKLSPRETLIQVMDAAFNDAQMEIVIDSIAILGVGPIFTLGESSWRKADYYMSMHFKMRDTAIYTTEFIEKMTTGLQDQFPERKVSYETKTKYFLVSGTEILFAIKDTPASEWMFLGYQKNPQLINALFPKEIIEHYKLLD